MMNIDLSNWRLLKSGQIEDEFEGFDDEMIFELTDGSVYSIINLSTSIITAIHIDQQLKFILMAIIKLLYQTE